jgi:hypothetical protein
VNNHATVLGLLTVGAASGNQIFINGAGSSTTQVTLYTSPGAGGLSLQNSTGRLSFFNATTIAKPTVSGSRADGTALASLLTTLATFGLIINSTTP